MKEKNNIQIELSKCDECGGQIVCRRYEEGGSFDFVGLYKHKCSQCKKVHKESDSIKEGHVGARKDTICPMCQKNHPM